ncbi:MAG TPA: hypothetical protein VFX19_04885 [Dehalococcoidia bacterium]|jgi:hypothetical protein|nr:hypothetical protein [Dehalococcoidia bacterium]
MPRSPVSAEQALETAHSANERTLYVYLCNGDVEAVSMAVRLGYDPQELLIFGPDREIACFPLEDIYFASFSKISPPAMF